MEAQATPMRRQQPTHRSRIKTTEPNLSPGKSSTVRNILSPGGTPRLLQRFNPESKCFQTVPPIGATEAVRKQIIVDNQVTVRNARAKEKRHTLSEAEKVASADRRKIARVASLEGRTEAEMADERERWKIARVASVGGKTEAEIADEKEFKAVYDLK
jgi:hypothetical protein